MAWLWPGAEVRVLARYYPEGGARACLPLLPERSKRQVYDAARDLGLSRIGRKPGSGLRR